MTCNVPHQNKQQDFLSDYPNLSYHQTRNLMCSIFSNSDLDFTHPNKESSCLHCMLIDTQCHMCNLKAIKLTELKISSTRELWRQIDKMITIQGTLHVHLSMQYGGRIIITRNGFFPVSCVREHRKTSSAFLLK